MKIPQFFEWDEDKCQANIDKHGIDFANIQAVFTNPIVISISRYFHIQVS